jgi:hypothetical protein
MILGGEEIMKGILIAVIVLILCQGTAPAQVRDVNVGISISDGRLRDFYFAIGEHYRVPTREIVEIRERYAYPEEDLPVIYFLAARAHVEPSMIISLRGRRMSWLDIAFHYHLTPDIFFVPVATVPIGPPYGNAYGHYKKYHPGTKIVLTDREVVDLVNLRFMSEHYHMRPETVMELRSQGNRFPVINEEIRGGKATGKPEKANQGQNGHGKNNKKR